MDSLGISTVLEGCRQLTKVAFTQLDIAESVFERMARQTTQFAGMRVWIGQIVQIFASFSLVGARSVLLGHKGLS